MWTDREPFKVKADPACLEAEGMKDRQVKKAFSSMNSPVNWLVIGLATAANDILSRMACDLRRQISNSGEVM